MAQIITSKRGSEGYTLIQMAIALLVIGLLAVGFLQAYQVYKQQQDFVSSQTTVETAVQKIQTYRQVFGFYPCPAPMDAARTDAAYGHASNCLDTSQAIGACAGGLCTQAYTRPVDTDNNALTPDVMTTIRVRVGAIPFRELQMDEKSTFDSYGSRLTYAVTEAMGDVTTFKELQGGIDIVDAQNQSLVEPQGSGSFIVLSHGQNKLGAFTDLGGAQIVPCPPIVAGPVPPGPPTASLLSDAENCVNFLGPPTSSTFVNTYRTEGDDAKFDDIVQYFATASNPMWRRTALTSDSITDMADDNVGIGSYSTATPPPKALSITQTTVDSGSGNMVTTNSTASGSYESGGLRMDDNGSPCKDPATGATVQCKMMANKYCNANGDICFQVKDFQGDPDAGTGGMKCPAGSYMVGITTNATKDGAIPVCKPVRVECAPNTVLVGVNADGSPNCGTVASACTSTTKPLCSSTITILPGGNGTQQTFTYNTGGACASITYICNSGTWGIKSGTDYSGTAYCTNAATTGIACTAPFTGTYTAYTCGGNTSSTTCVCHDTDTNNPVSCPAPWTSSSQTQHCTQTCVGNVLQPPVCDPVVGTCGCSKTNYYDFASCDPGFVRKASPTPATFALSPNSWPADTTKGKYRLLTVDASCNYDSPTYDNSNCECDGKPSYNKVLKNPGDYAAVNPDFALHPACYKPRDGTRNVMDGAALAVGSVTWDYAVTKTPKNPTTCNLDPSGTTTLDEAQFVPRPYKWIRQPGAKTNASTEATTGGYPEANDSCTCQSDAGATHACAVASGTGYDFYTCKCTAQ